MIENQYTSDTNYRSTKYAHKQCYNNNLASTKSVKLFDRVSLWQSESYRSFTFKIMRSQRHNMRLEISVEVQRIWITLISLKNSLPPTFNPISTPKTICITIKKRIDLIMVIKTTLRRPIKFSQHPTTFRITTFFCHFC